MIIQMAGEQLGTQRQKTMGQDIPVGLSPGERSELPPFYSLRAFEAVVACGGIRKAATALSVDHAAISRHLKSLEEWAGVPLVDRSAGSGGRLTPVGAKYHEAIAGALKEIARASHELRYQCDDTRLSILCAPGLASDWLMERIGQFSGNVPGVELELQPSEVEPDVTDFEVDAYIHYVPDVKTPFIDAALRSVEIARPQMLPVASPQFLATIPRLHNPRDMIDAVLIHEASSDQWRRWFSAQDVDPGDHLAGPKFWQNHLTLAAARRGQGITLANSLIVNDDLRAGRLVEVGPWKPVFLGSYFFTARRIRWRERNIAQFRKWLEDTVRSAI